MSASTDRHMKLALRVLKYLKATSHLQLKFSSSESFSLAAFCDLNWGCCIDARRSIIEYCIYLRDSLVSLKSKKQTTMARSLAKVAYRAIVSTMSELL